MIYDHYGYQPLPQHAGPWFFNEQIAHLEVAVKEAVPVKKDFSPRHMLAFEEKVEGKTYKCLQGQKDYIAYRELAKLVGIYRKSASTAVRALRRQGYQFEEKTVNQVIFVRLK